MPSEANTPAASPRRWKRLFILGPIVVVFFGSLGLMLYIIQHPNLEIEPGADWSSPGGLGGSGFISFDHIEGEKRFYQGGVSFEDQVYERSSTYSLRVWGLLIWIRIIESETDPLIEEMTPAISWTAPKERSL